MIRYLFQDPPSSNPGFHSPQSQRDLEYLLFLKVGSQTTFKIPKFVVPRNSSRSFPLLLQSLLQHTAWRELASLPITRSSPSTSPIPDVSWEVNRADRTLSFNTFLTFVVDHNHGHVPSTMLDPDIRSQAFYENAGPTI